LALDRNVGLAKDATRPRFRGERLALRHAAPGDDDFGALRDENLNSPQSDAAGGAGNDRDLAVQPSDVTFFLIWRVCHDAGVSQLDCEQPRSFPKSNLNHWKAFLIHFICNEKLSSGAPHPIEILGVFEIDIQSSASFVRIAVHGHANAGA
jgi:hypothetical protein